MKEENAQVKAVLTLQKHLKEFSSEFCFVELNNESMKDSLSIQLRKSYILNSINAAIKNKKEEWENNFSHYECNKYMIMPTIPMIFVASTAADDTSLEAEATIYNIPSDLLSDVDNYLRSKQDTYNGKIIVKFQRAIIKTEMDEWTLQFPPELKPDPSIKLWGTAIRKKRGSEFFNSLPNSNSNDSVDDITLFNKSPSSSPHQLSSTESTYKNTTQASAINHTYLDKNKNMSKDFYPTYNKENDCYLANHSSFFNSTTSDINTSKSKDFSSNISDNTIPKHLSFYKKPSNDKTTSINKHNTWDIKKRVVEPFRALFTK